GLVLVLQPGVERSTPTQAKVDLGRLDALGSVPVERTLRLRNEGTGPLLLGSVQSSCGCTSSLLTREGKPIQTLLSNQETSLNLRLDVTRLHAGPFSKTLL